MTVNILKKPIEQKVLNASSLPNIICVATNENCEIKTLENPMHLKDLKCSYCLESMLYAPIIDPSLSKDRAAICGRPFCKGFCGKAKQKLSGKITPFTTQAVFKSEEYKNKTLDNFRAEASFIKAAKSFCEDNRWCLTLYGASRTGKTHFSIGILKHFCAVTNLGGVFDTVSSIMFEIKEHMSSGKNEQRVVEKYSEYDFLVLDDLGTERGTDFQLDTLYSILETRERNNKKTVISTNLSIKNAIGGESEFQKRYGTRMSARVLGQRAAKIQFPLKTQ